MIPKPQHTSKNLPFSSPFARTSRRRSTSYSAEDFKTPITFRSKAGYKADLNEVLTFSGLKRDFGAHWRLLRNAKVCF